MKHFITTAMCVFGILSCGVQGYAHDHTDVRLSMISLQANVVGPGQYMLLGDSNMEQYWWNTSDGVKILNAGVGGAGIDTAIAIADHILPIAKPSKVFISIGVNDCVRGNEYDPEVWGNKLIMLIDMIKASGAKPICGSILPVEANPALPLGSAYFNNTTLQLLNNKWYNIVISRGEKYINLNYTFGDPTQAYRWMLPGFTVDGVHLNRIGNINFYTQVVSAFRL